MCQLKLISQFLKLFFSKTTYSVKLIHSHFFFRTTLTKLKEIIHSLPFKNLQLRVNTPNSYYMEGERFSFFIFKIVHLILL